VKILLPAGEKSVRLPKNYSHGTENIGKSKR
jgi:hypothetical protein